MTLQNVLFTIVRFSLWGERFEDEIFASFSENDWRELYLLTNQQGLSAISANGIGKLPQKSPVCIQLLLEEGIPAIIEAENRWDEQLKLATKLAKTLKKNGVKMLLLKGLGLSLYYPEPKHRECSDIDIYLFGDYEKGNQLAKTILGANVERFSKKEDHIIIGDYSIDNHICFLWAVNKKKREFDGYLKSLLNRQDLPRFEGTDILLPTVEFNFFFLFSHSYGHFMREGITLRQITDIACFLDRNNTNLDWEKNMQTLQSFGIKVFADAVIAFIVYYFRLSFVYVPNVDISLLERVKDDIISGSHQVVYHKNRIESKLYIARTSWKNRWRYNAFYEGGYRRFVFESLKRLTLSLPHLGAL